MPFLPMLDEEDLLIPAAELSNPALRAQVAYYRAWTKASGFTFTNLDIFYAEQETRNTELEAQISACRSDCQSLVDEYNALVTTREDIQGRLSDAKKEFVRLSINPGLSARAPGGKAKALTDCKNLLEEIRGQIVAATRACEKQLEELEPWNFFIDYFNQHIRVNNEVKDKITRMRTLEEEFKSRNAFAKNMADYHAWTMGKESTYVEPKISESAYAHAFVVGGPCGEGWMVSEAYNTGNVDPSAVSAKPGGMHAAMKEGLDW